MKYIRTQIDDLKVLEIQRTGKSIYGFLQEAVQEKLDNINSINAIEVMNLKLDKQTEEFQSFKKQTEDTLQSFKKESGEEFQSFKKQTEDALLKTIEIVVKYTNRSETILTDFKAMHEKNRDDTNAILKKIGERLAELKRDQR